MNFDQYIEKVARCGMANPPTSVAGRRRVLLVENDTMTRWRLLCELRRADLEVEFAPNVIIAWQKFRRCRPQAIVLGTKPRSVAGYEFLRAVRRDPDSSSCPLYLLTAVDQMNRAGRKAACAANACVLDRGTTLPEQLAERLARDLSAGDPGQTTAPSPQPSPASEAAAAAPDLNPADAVASVCRHAEAFAQTTAASDRLLALHELQRGVRALLAAAATARHGGLARQAGALDSFIHVLKSEPARLADPVCADTIHCAVTPLPALLADLTAQDAGEFTAVLVEEDAARLAALAEAFSEAGFAPVCFGERADALAHLATHPAHAIVLPPPAPAEANTTLPAIRELALHQDTPVLTGPPATQVNSIFPAEDQLATSITIPSITSMKLVIQALNLVQQAVQPAKPVMPPEAAPAAAEARPAASAPPPPTAPADQETAATAPVSTPRAEPLRTMLFIEDDPLVLKMYRSRLEREGFRVECAEDGLAALDLLPRLRPDIVVLDLMLPKLHGLEVLKFVRTDVQLKATPVIVLSNAYLEGLAAKALAAGANRGILKTQCNPAKLIATARELLGGEAGETATPVGAAPPPAMEAADHERSALVTARVELLADAPAEIGRMRKDCLNYIKAVGQDSALEHLIELYRRVRFFAGRAALCGFTEVNDLTSAFEAVLFDVVFKNSEPTPSALQTTVQAVDCLGRMVSPGVVQTRTRAQKSRVLVVDDDAVFNHTTCTALKRANLDVVTMQDSAASLRLMEQEPFDLVLLDINMPGLDGFALCEALRRLPAYRTTPVVFVTMHSEFQNRARSIITGGNGLIGKPVSPLELTLKVTMLLLDPGATLTKNQLAATTTPAANVDSAEVEAVPANRLATRDETPALPAGDSTRHRLAPEPATLPSSRTHLESSGSRIPTEPATVATVGSETQLEAAGAAVGVAEQVGELRPLPPNQDRESLVMRIYTVETELHSLAGRVQRRDRTIKSLKEQLAQRDAKCRELEGRHTAAIPDPAASETTQREIERLTRANHESEEWCRQLTHQMNQLRLDRDELDRKSARDYEALQSANRRVAELEAQAAGADATLHKEVESWREREAETRRQREALQLELASEKTAKGQVETAHKESQERATQTEQALDALKLEQREHRQREILAQAESRKTTRRLAKLEQALKRSAGGARRRQTEFTAELHASQTARQKLESDLEQARAQAQQLDRELASLREQERGHQHDLEQQHAAVSEAGRQLARFNEQLKQREAEHQSRLADDQQATEALRRELTAARSDRQAAEHDRHETQSRCAKLETELECQAETRRALETQRAEALAATEAVNRQLADLETQTKQRLDAAQHDAENLRQELAASRTARETTETARAADQSKREQLETEITRLRQERLEQDHDLALERNQLFDARRSLADFEQQGARQTADAKQETEALRRELVAAQTALAQADADRQAAAGNSQAIADECARLRETCREQKAQLDEQQSDLAEGQVQAELGWQESFLRCGELETELAGLRRENERLAAECARAAEAQAASTARLEEEAQLSQAGQAAFERELAELENRLRLSATAQAQAAADLAGERAALQATRKEADSLAARVKALHDELSWSLAEQSALRDSVAKSEALLRERDEALAGAKAELETEAADRRVLAEEVQASAVRQQTLKESLSVLEEECQRQQASQAALENRAATSLRQAHESEMRFQTEAQARRQLAEALADTANRLAGQTHRREELEVQLAHTRERLAESEARLQQEAGQRRQLTEALERSQATHREATERETLEQARLEAALRGETARRKRVEAQLAQQERVAAESVRAGGVVRCAIRRQVRGPMEALCRSARRLAGLRPEGPQDQLVRAMLAEALLVQQVLDTAGDLRATEDPPSGAEAVTASVAAPVAVGQTPLTEERK